MSDTGLEIMHSGEKARLRATIDRIRKLHPGPTGDILIEFVDSWIEFGYRFDSRGIMQRFVKEVWGTKLPGEDSIDDQPWVEVD